MSSTDNLISKLDLIFERAKLDIQNVMNERQPVPPERTATVLDEETQTKVNEYVLIAHKPYLTRREVAVYLNVSERSIAEWSARPMDQNPFPVQNAGGEPRYKREKVDEWTEREAQRKRLKLAS